MIVSAVALVTLSLNPLALICEGFTVPSGSRRLPAQRLRQNLPTLYFQEDENTIVTSPAKDLVAAVLEGEVLPLIDADIISNHIDIPTDSKTSSLFSLSYEDDIEGYLDISRPYYTIANEHAIVDDQTGEVTGVLCTGRVEIPSKCESSDISFADAGRQMAVAGEVAALLCNPQKKRFYYLASNYHCTAQPNTGRVRGEVAKLLGNRQSPIASTEPIILARCTEFSKRTAKCHILLEHGDTTWELTINYTIIAAQIFEKMYPVQKVFSNPTTGISYESIRLFHDVKTFADPTGEWLTMDALVPPCKTSLCEGHFQHNPILPHSFMLVPNVDIIGETISQFTGMSSNKTGIQLLSWECLPEALHFPETCGLKYQCKIFLRSGELGKFGSTYVAESVVKQQTGVVCYKATSEFVLRPREK